MVVVDLARRGAVEEVIGRGVCVCRGEGGGGMGIEVNKSLMLYVPVRPGGLAVSFSTYVRTTYIWKKKLPHYCISHV